MPDAGCRMPEADTLHWPGLAIPGNVDGGPVACIEKLRLPSQWGSAL